MQKMAGSFFNKLCWICLAEHNNMISLLQEGAKVKIDTMNSSISMFEMLQSVVSSNILFTGGPYLICANCQIQARTAYKFKKRCEISLQIFRKYNLEPCSRANFEVKNAAEVFTPKENVMRVLSDQDEKKGCTDLPAQTKLEMKTESSPENSPLTSINSDNNIYLIVDNEPAVTSDIPTDCPKPRRSHHGAPKKFLCTICGLQKNRNTIRQHMLRHANIKNHACPYCQRRFSDKSNLSVHIRIHTGIHPYSCDVCGKKFIQASSLKAHKRIHNDVRPYKCHICTYSTRTSGHLQLHIKRHIGVKNYHCEQCDYSACTKAELKYHMATHSTDKCHICKICGKGFTRRKNLKTHEKSHSGEKPHICELCGRGFTQAHSLRSHLRNIHKQTI